MICMNEADYVESMCVILFVCDDDDEGNTEVYFVLR